MNKQTSLESAIASITHGASILIGGFGSPGTPFSLINELLKQGQKELTLIKNDGNEPAIGISKLIENGQVTKLITSHIGLNKTLVDMMNRNKLEVEFHPQGILAEKIRNAGAGNFGFLSDIGIDTEITDHSQLITWQGKQFKVESALYADFALIHAKCSDIYGNLIYGSSARNFSPLMAMAADNVIVETPNIVSAGELNPEHIHTPSVFVNKLVYLEQLTEDYQCIEAHLGH